METLLTGLIRRRFLVIAFFVLLAIGGIFSFKHIPIDAFPDLTNEQVQILTEAPGFSPVETEQLVTIPIETVMNGLPNVQQVRSISKVGLSVVTVVFQDGTDIYFARQLVNERLQSVRSRIPEGLNPELGPVTTGMGEIYQYIVEGYGYSPEELKTLHDWYIRYQLRSIPGVSEVNTWGGFTREYHISVTPERLLQTGLTLRDIFRAVAENNQSFNGGIIERGPEQAIIHGQGRVQDLSEIGSILIRKQGLAPITVRQVADVSVGHALRQGGVTKDGQGEVVSGIVMMLKGENSRAVIHQVKEKMRTLRNSLPEGIRLRPFYDQTRLIEQTMDTVRTNLLEGGLLVIAVLFLMLGNFRAALIAAITIPISLLCSFIGMKAMGIPANILSLGAMDFGMIVDGSVVMVENTLRKLSKTDSHDGTSSAILQSTREMARPILFGVLIIAVVYLPILSLEGMEAKMFSPMVFTISFALLGSLLVALLLAPVLCSFFLKGRIVERESLIIRAIRKPYLRLLEKALQHPVRVACIALAAFSVAVFSIPFLGTEFVPKLDEGDLIVETRNLPGSSLEEAVRVSTRIENVLKRFPEVKTVVSKTGRPDLATDPMSVNMTDVYVILKPKTLWRPGITKASLTDVMRHALEKQVPNAHFSFTQPIAMRVDELVSGARSDVAIKLFGEDMDVLMAKAREIEQVMRTVPGHADLQTEKPSGSGQLSIIPDRSKMALYGVNITDIRDLIETVSIGKPVSEVLEGGKRFTLRVKLPTADTRNLDSLRNLRVENAAGERIPLGQVASLQLGEGLETVNREAGQRRIVIQMNVKNRDIGSFVREGQAKVAKVKLPPGYSIAWGGQFENQQRAMSRLAVVVPLAILAIVCLLFATFSTIRHVLLVLLNVPFALIGGVAALWLRGMYLSVPACIGFIALFGVAMLNGLVLVSTMNRLKAQGMPLPEVILRGAETRLRPVLITALVAMLGFLPMALSEGAGAEVQKPLATVVIGGLLTSTLLTLLVLPVFYRWIESRWGQCIQTLPASSAKASELAS